MFHFNYNFEMHVPILVNSFFRNPLSGKINKCLKRGNSNTVNENVF